MLPAVPAACSCPGDAGNLAGGSLGEPLMLIQPRELNATVSAFVPRDPSPVLPGAKSCEVPQDSALNEPTHVQREDDLSTIPTIPDPRTLEDTVLVLQLLSRTLPWMNQRTRRGRMICHRPHHPRPRDAGGRRPGAPGPCHGQTSALAEGG